jgi:multicomponent K+:H+ antiporter subunit A
MQATVTLPLLVLCAFAASALPPLLAGNRSGGGRKRAALASAAVMLAGLALLAPLAGPALDGATLVHTLPWLSGWGLTLSFRLDALGLLFCLLILGIGLLVVLYAYYYLPAVDPLGRFFGLLLLFMAAMLGMVLAENLLLLVVFWEVTGLASFLLIAYRYKQREAREAARMALTVTGLGGLALLGGVLLLGRIAGSYELSDVLAAGDAIRAHELYLPALLLILLGAFTKSAQFPFHFWLPNAMAAPTPVSAYLHSATLVKAGVFLLARLFPALSGTDAWFWLVGGAGAVTLAYSAYIALHRYDIKGLLAYSTTSHLGLIVLLFGLDTPLSLVAAVFHIINHAIFKASLFMAAGIVDHECGTRDMRRINGLFQFMPVTATLAIVAAAAMAGVPLLNGFLSKEMFFAETVGHPAFERVSWLLPLFATTAGMLTVAYSSRFIHDVFFNGQPVDLPRQPHEPPRWMRVPVEVLVVLCLLVGLFPQFSVAPLLQAAAGAALQAPAPEFALALWHGFNAPFAMSLLAFAGGLLLYWARRRVYALHERLPSLHALESFVAFQAGFEKLARRGVAALDNGSLQRQLALLFAFTLGLGAWATFSAAHAPIARLPGLPADGAAWGALAALSLAALTATALHRQRLMALVFVSVVGLIVALAFVRFSAPDLALTQLSVEVVTIVLLLLALRHLPPLGAAEPGRARMARDLALAVAGGLGMAGAAWLMLTSPLVSLSGYYLEHALPDGGGANVVNVILVDFRGFDTLGEIAVLALVALSAHALLDRLTLAAPAQDAEGRPWSEHRHPLFLAMLTRPLLPLVLAVAVYLLLRGHHQPGGGFVAGLITGVALILQYLASGIGFARPLLPRRQTRLLALGLALAAGTGAASWLFGHPFLTSTYGHVAVPLLGEIELASALAFDLGVYGVVVMTVLIVLGELGRLSQTRRTEAD